MKLAPIETEVIDLFVHLARLLNLPKSVAEIYGLLFIAPEPLPMEAITRRLDLSKGAASQGLRLLRKLGAVRVVYAAGKRSDHFEAERELRKLIGGLIHDQLQPQFDDGGNRLQRIQELSSQLPAPDRHRVRERLHRLQQWQQAGQRFLPLLQQCFV